MQHNKKKNDDRCWQLRARTIKMILRDQDQQADQLLDSVSRIKHVAGLINTELQEQGEMLEEVEVGIDRTRGFIATTKRQLDSLMQSCKSVEKGRSEKYTGFIYFGNLNL